MANNFAGDPRVKALWRFEDNLNDSVGGNHLTDVNGVAYFNAPAIEGTKSGLFDKETATCAYRNDADLDAGFPLKVGDASKKITVCFWIKPDSYATYMDLFAKWDWAGDKCSLEISRNTTTLFVNVGSGDGSNHEFFNTGCYIQNWETCHVAVCIDGVAKTIYVRLWNGSVIDTFTDVLADELWVGDTPLYIGGMMGSNCMDGKLDEIVVFNDLLTDYEIDAIRGGAYVYPETKVVAFGAGVNVAYEPDSVGTVRVLGTGANVAYQDLNIGTVRVAGAGLMVAYLPGIAFHRILPVGPTERTQVSQAFKRRIPANSFIPS